MTDTEDSAEAVRVETRARTFDSACELVVSYLATTVPMGLWAVTRVVDSRQVMLTVESPGYPMSVGGEVPFPTSLCAEMIAGRAPAIAPDTAAVRSYTMAVASADQLGFRIGAYAGAPILGPSGQLFGTVCGFNTAAAPGLDGGLEPLLAVFAGLLSAVLAGDLAATDASREIERARDLADVDELTGLLNRRGWSRFLEMEEARYRRFGDTAAVVVMDVDDFKSVNQLHGQQAADRLLRAVAHIIDATAKAGNIVARLAGDEFGLILIGAGRQEAESFIRRLEHALVDTGLSVSTGYAPYTVARGFAGAWEEADLAMYATKRRRRAAAGAASEGAQDGPTPAV